MDNTSDTDLAAKLRKHAADADLSPRQSQLEKIIKHRRVILELRDRDHSTRQIWEWLGKEGIHMNEGTLRNYIARLSIAECQARDDGIVSPGDADILRICRDIAREKAARLKAGKFARSFPRTNTTPYLPPKMAAISPFPAHLPVSPTLRSDNDL